MLYGIFFALLSAILFRDLELYSMSRDTLAGAMPIAHAAHISRPAITLEQHVACVRQNFNNLGRVPKEMRHLVLRQLGISHLLTVAHNPDFRTIVLEYLRKYETMLDLSQEISITPERMHELGEQRPNTTILILPAIEEADTIIEKIAQCFKNLKYLAIPKSSVTNDNARVIAENLLRLEELELRYNQAVIGQDFVTVLVRLPFLSTFNVQNSVEVTPEAQTLLEGWNASPQRKATY